MAAIAALLTTEDLLALPDDGIDRELIEGELREKPLTTRGVPHCLVTVNLSHALRDWLRRQPRPRGLLVAGEARVRLRRDPDTVVGIDLAYIAADLATQTGNDAKYIDGPPVLAARSAAT